MKAKNEDKEAGLYNTRGCFSLFVHTERAEPTSGKVDMRETNAGGFAVAVSIGGSLGSEDEGDEVEIYAEEVGGVREPDMEFDMSMLDNNNNKIINGRGPLLHMSLRAFTAIRTPSSWSSSMVVERTNEFGRACYTLPSKPLRLLAASATTHLHFFSVPYSRPRIS